MNKWKKVIIGAVLLAVFALYTQYEKNAEPVWKVDEKNFMVVNSIKQGMKQEYLKVQELETLEKYGLLPNGNKTIVLEREHRTLKIEKIWNMHGRLYVLYSVDLKERDRDEKDVPRLTVKNMKISSDETNKEVVLPASDGHSADDGFVYKHRLYRSMFLVPYGNDYNEDTWRTISTAARIELQDVQSAKENNSYPLKNIAFKVNSEDISKQVLESSPIHKKFTYGENKEAEIRSYDILLYDKRLSISIPKDDALIGFTGWYQDKSYPHTWGLIGTDTKGYSLLFNEDPIFMDTDEIKRSFTIEKSLHREKGSYSWSIPKEDIMKINKKTDETIEKNNTILTKNDTALIYEGLTLYNGRPAIEISMLHSENMNNHLINLNTVRDYESIPEEFERIFKINLISISNEREKDLQNFHFYGEESTDKTSYFISFFEGDNDQAIQNIPEEDLTITISNLIYSKPLPSPVTIPYEVPKVKKSNK